MEETTRNGGRKTAMTLRIRLAQAHPAFLVLAGFLAAILLGTLALELPMAVTRPLSWVDALFTATSAVCVTGLVVVDTSSAFTTFGQCVILVLIQIGGLGVMTVSVALFRWIGHSVSYRQRKAMLDLFAHTPRGDIFKLVKSVVLFTLAAELVGAACLAVHWSHEYPPGHALYLGLFHAVSAFCNAGFALFPDSMVRYSGDALLNVTVGGLIVLGGIGFPVLYDLQTRWTGGEKRRLSVQTKVVLATSLLLIVLGALMFELLERQSFGAMKATSHHFLTSFFQSITCRTAGFNTVDIASLEDATLCVMLFLMFFGASPGSCGGGVKTTTLALLALFTASRIRRQRCVNVCRKTIPAETVTRSLSLVLVSGCLIAVVLFMLLVGETVSGHVIPSRHGSFLFYLFETVSAFGTVGLSMGVTPLMNTWGKCWIMLTMLVGRVGVLTFSYIIVGAGGTRGIEHADENMMIG